MTEVAMDQESQDKLLFENAHKYRLHLDNLRWTLSGGYAAFFYGSMLLLKNDKIEKDQFLVDSLLVLFTIFGSAYLLAVTAQHWYYNAYAAYAHDCDQKLREGKPLLRIGEFARDKVGFLHPAFGFILLLIASGNTFYLIRILSTKMSVCWSLICALGFLACTWFAMYLLTKHLRRRYRKWENT